MFVVEEEFFIGFLGFTFFLFVVLLWECGSICYFDFLGFLTDFVKKVYRGFRILSVRFFYDLLAWIISLLVFEEMLLLETYYSYDI